MYEVRLSAEALRVYQRAQAPLARKLSRCLAVLSETPHVHPNIKPLSAKYAGSWRYRVGDWRVVYQIDDARQRVFVVTIVHRREAYR